MQREKTDKFCYPCVYSINSTGKVTFWYSSQKEISHYVPKVIFPGGAFQSVNVVVDMNGEYGLTQFAKGIVDLPQNLEAIAKALRSKKFINLYPSFSSGTTELDKDIIATFRSDFWREFE
jgi:hypothetical protein